jgi:hypothetical protein
MSSINEVPNTPAGENGQSKDGLDQSSPSFEETIRLGQDAWARARADHTWSDWLKIGAALSVLRTEAMREAHVNKPEGRNYSTAFAAGLKKYGFENIDSGDRTRLFKVMTNISAIEKWRATLPLNQRLPLNHPSTVLRRWKSTSTVPAQNASPKTSAIAKLKEANIELREKLYRAERELSHGGGDLWTPEDTPQDTANIMLGKLTSNKAERVARAILAKLKEKRKAAGSEPRVQDAMSTEDGKAPDAGVPS